MSQKPYNEWMFEFWGEKYAKFQTKAQESSKRPFYLRDLIWESGGDRCRIRESWHIIAIDQIRCRHFRSMSWIFRIPGTGFLMFCQWTLDSAFQSPRLTEERVLNGPSQIIRDQTLHPLFKDQELNRNLHLRLINNFDWRWYFMTRYLSCMLIHDAWFLQSTFVLEVSAVDLNYYLRSFSSC